MRFHIRATLRIKSQTCFCNASEIVKHFSYKRRLIYLILSPLFKRCKLLRGKYASRKLSYIRFTTGKNKITESMQISSSENMNRFHQVLFLNKEKKSLMDTTEGVTQEKSIYIIFSTLTSKLRVVFGVKIYSFDAGIFLYFAYVTKNII